MANGTFVGRERYLALLDRELRSAERSGEGRFLAVRGRRRVGKSTLIERFLESAGVPHAFFTATPQPIERELDRFCETIAESSLPAARHVAGGVRPTNWEAALRLIADTAEPRKPAVVVIDEFPYLAKQYPPIESVFQVAWDHRLSRVPVMLVLVGSDLGMMESLTAYDRPLYGRPTRELVVDPLTVAEVADLLGLSPADAIDAYLIVGGFPQLAVRWGRGRSRAGFLREMLADYSSPLIVDGERAVSAEFPPETQARNVLSAIGAGETAFGKIQARARVEASTLKSALETLERKRAIEKLTPFAAKPRSRATRYVVSDPYLRFWLRFVEPGMDLIERGRGDAVAGRVLDGWSEYRGKAVEPLVRASIERLLPSEPYGSAYFVHGYWTRDNLVEVDLVGADRKPRPREAPFVGSIKWRERARFTKSDVAGLRALVDSVPLTGPATRLVGVSRSGFDGAEGLDVQLGPADLVDAWRRSFGAAPGFDVPSRDEWDREG